ncbi:MAG TPA: SPOR domain-containing protein [Allosphingosinicella sp.]|jgi:Flp pilus assembly protein TadD
MNRFASKIAASTMVIAVAMVGCHSDALVVSASASTAQRSEQQASRYAEQARAAVQAGDAARAVGLAERAVELAPRDVGYRMLLADVYLRSGRFRSAESAYGDVLALDPGNARAGLSTALVQIGQGRNGDALVALEGLNESAPASDVGLAYALAGQPQRAIQLLEPAARAPGANGRTRQNLALAYAIAGDWQRARVVAAQDVSPAELSGRLRQWAAFANPAAPHSAVASLLGVSPGEDPGQPVRLALSQPEPQPQAFAQAEPAVEAPAPIAGASAETSAETPVQLAEAPAAVPLPEPIHYAEAPVVAASAPTAAAPANWWPSPAHSAPAEVPAAAEPAPQPEVRYAAAVSTLSAPSPVLSRPQVAPARASRPTFRPAPIARVAAVSARIPRIGSGGGRFVVQLGAFTNPQNAERAWRQASARFGLANAEARTARVTVNGRSFTRVAIAGFGTRADAVRVCSSIQARGGSCFVRALAGDVPVRWASNPGRGRRA